MALKLDRRWPLTWRSPSSVQFGVDPAIVILDDVTTVEERMLAALTVGVSLPGLALITGGDVAERDRFLERIGPALLAEETGMRRRLVAISGTGPLPEELARLLASEGLRVVMTDDPDELDPASPDLAIVTGHYVLSPASHARWLRRDVPHLPVVVSDASVTVGPVIEPGDGPCLLCVELHHRDADEAWPAVAAQLLGRRSAVESALVASDGAVAAARAAIARLDGVAAGAVSLRIDVVTGTRSERRWFPHPECGCGGIAHLVAAGVAAGA